MESKPSSRPSIKAVLAEVACGAIPGSSMSDAEYAQLGELGGIPAPLVGVVLGASEALGRRLNFASKNTLERTFAAPYEAVLKAFVLALQAQKLRMTVAFDTAHGACVEADLPNDMFSRGGTLSFSIGDGTTTTTISGTSEIRGQRFDWGKGNRALGDLFAKTEHYIGTLNT